MDIGQQIDKTIKRQVKQVVKEFSELLAEHVASENGGLRDLVSGFSDVKVDIEISADGRKATVQVIDSVEFGGKTRIKHLNDGIPAYRQPTDRRPMPIKIGYRRKTTPRSLKGSAGSPPTDTIYRYYRGEIEAGEWDELLRKRTRDAAQQKLNEAVRKVR